MKTIEEKAREYADRCYAVNPDEIGGVLYRETIADFKAGYKAAFEWRSIDKELPSDRKLVITKRKRHDGSISYHPNMMVSGKWALEKRDASVVVEWCEIVE